MRLPSLIWVLATLVIIIAAGLVITADRSPTPTSEPSAASGERDTTAEEVRAVATTMNDMQQQMDDETAARQRENDQLRQEIQQRVSEIDAALQNFAVEAPQEVISALGDISNRLAALEQPPVTAFDPESYDYTVSDDFRPSIVWVESLTASPTATPTALEAVVPPSEPPPPDPRYTLPPASIIDATALTALVGRIQVDGRIDTPWRFKLLSTAVNMTSRRFQVPDLEGVIWSGVAYGDYTLSCVRGTIDTVSYVFADGTVHSQRSESNPDDITAGIGWISDAYGNPCVPGEFKTNAPAVIRRLATAGTIEGLARGYAEAQTRRTTNSEGETTATVTGNADDYALSTAVSEAVSESNRWLLSRLSDSFDAVYVPAGADIVIHIEQQVAIDHDSFGRRIDHHQHARARVPQNETLGLHD